MCGAMLEAIHSGICEIVSEGVEHDLVIGAGEALACPAGEPTLAYCDVLGVAADGDVRVVCK